MTDPRCRTDSNATTKSKWIQKKDCMLFFYLVFIYKMKAHIQFWVFFYNVEVILWRAMIFETKSHGPKHDDDEAKWKFLEKSRILFFTYIWNPRRKHIFNFRCFFRHLTHFLTKYPPLKWRGKISPAKTATRTPSPLASSLQKSHVFVCHVFVTGVT